MAKEQEVASAEGNPPAHRESAAMNGAQLLMAQGDSSGLMSGAPVEGGIVSDVSAIAEPEIEVNEGSVEEHESGHNVSAVVKGDMAEAGCPIEMHADYALGFRVRKCGRKLHAAFGGADEMPVCLMHSKDPIKQSSPLFDAFWQEFERTLEAAKEGEAHFEGFVFPRLRFSGNSFQANCEFRGATFTKNADFRHMTFMQSANFEYATFMKDAYFNNAVFNQDACFIRAKFSQSTSFEDTIFHGTATWHSCQFLDRAEFRGTKFCPQFKILPCAIFELAKFSNPGEIIFDNVNLSRVFFHNCDVSQVWFTSSVEWPKRQGQRGLAVFEEKLLLEEEFEVASQIFELPDFRAVAQIYQQLKKNYDSRLDYWTANEFHFGEMEMKRLAVPERGRLFLGGWMRRHGHTIKLLHRVVLLRMHARQQLMRLRGWLHRNLSFVAWYKYASDYGNSYRKPLLWLVGVLLAAEFLFPITGLELKQAISGNAASSARVTYSSVWNKKDSWSNNFWTEGKLIGKSGITAIDTATFQRTPEYTPVYPRGRVVAIVETLLTSSLFALFLLAIRRQFRR
jgi:uncharacterized protein YjbI with pentapeptide repeats